MMKVITPEISWHAKEAIYSIDLQPSQSGQPQRLATAGIDGNIRIWEINSKSKTGITFLSNLLRHDKAVNVLRFSRSGDILASGGDDCTIILWKLSEKEEPPNIFEDESDIGQNVESWRCSKMLRGHLEDINEICWSSDEKYMISGSIDHTAILWDVVKGCKTHILSEAKHFIQGVAWDPQGQYLAALSCDRSLRIYTISNHRVMYNVNKMVYPSRTNSTEPSNDGEDVPVVKPQRMFHDESVVRRRLEFTCDGNLLIAPAGCLTVEQDGQSQQINTAYIFTRGCLNKPATILPGFKEPVTVIRCCPVKFQHRTVAENSETDPIIKLPYRMVFAAASSDTLLLYDTQYLQPFALIGNIHYAAITDVTWSSNGQNLVVSSRDGFCTIIRFEENELGLEYNDKSTVGTKETEKEQVFPNKKVLCNGVTDTKTRQNSDKPIVILDDDIGSPDEVRELENSPKQNDVEMEEILPVTKEVDGGESLKSGEDVTQTENLRPGAKDVAKDSKLRRHKDSPAPPPESTALKNNQISVNDLIKKEPTNCENTQNNIEHGQTNEKTKTNSLKLPQPSSQESKPRRVPLITLSEKSPVTKSPSTPKRRVQLTTLSDVHGSNAELKTPTGKQLTPSSKNYSPAVTAPNSAALTPKNSSKTNSASKKGPRRIQLTPVVDNK